MAGRAATAALVGSPVSGATGPDTAAGAVAAGAVLLAAEAGGVAGLQVGRLATAAAGGEQRGTEGQRQQPQRLRSGHRLSPPPAG